MCLLLDAIINHLCDLNSLYRFIFLSIKLYYSKDFISTAYASAVRCFFPGNDQLEQVTFGEVYYLTRFEATGACETSSPISVVVVLLR